MADRLRALWDFDDLAVSETRFKGQLSVETTDEGRAEVLTQLARIGGLKGDFDLGEELIAQATALAGESPSARSRIDLERGRLYRSNGNSEAALPLFQSAFATSVAAGEHFIAADAAHMAALAAPNRDVYVAWTERGIELAETNDDASYWLGPLLNNLGWELYEAGEHSAALAAFRRALAAREKDPANQAPIALARYAVGKALRALGRSKEGVPLLEQAVAWAVSTGSPDGWFHEELALEYAALGWFDRAGEQARLALSLLPGADPEFDGDVERAGRLRGLAGF